VDSAAQPITTGQIPDLRDTLLGELAGQIAGGDAILDEVVLRVTDDRGAPSRVSAMAFNSAL
jgi:FXSXX-COOH protein